MLFLLKRKHQKILSTDRKLKIKKNEMKEGENIKKEYEQNRTQFKTVEKKSKNTEQKENSPVRCNGIFIHPTVRNIVLALHSL